MEDSLGAVAPPKRGKMARSIAKVLHLRSALRRTKDGDSKSRSSSFRFEDDAKSRSSSFRFEYEGRSRSSSFRFLDEGRSRSSSLRFEDGGRSRSSSLRFEDEGTSRTSSFRFWDAGRTSVDEKVKERVVMEALLARLFASVSFVKASYAQLQLAQCPYDWDEIRSADQLSELKSLSELRQCYVTKHFDFLPENDVIAAEIQEQNSALKTYKFTLKKLEIQSKLKDSEIEKFKAQLKECNKRNKLMQKKLNESGHLYVLDNVHPSGLIPNHCNAVLRHAVRSIRSFVKMMVSEMDSAGWDLSAAASVISSGAVYWKDDHICFAFESFVSQEMFIGFQDPCYSLEDQSFNDVKARTRHFYEKFNEMRSASVNEYLSSQPNSTFGKFCQAKYLSLIHPDMELSFCEDLTQRKLITLGGFPETTFFSSFAEMAKRVWLLHCLAFSFNPQVSIFKLRSGCRFSELYMESVADEAFLKSETEPKVAFTVIPGFQIGTEVVSFETPSRPLIGFAFEIRIVPRGGERNLKSEVKEIVVFVLSPPRGTIRTPKANQTNGHDVGLRISLNSKGLKRASLNRYILIFLNIGMHQDCLHLSKPSDYGSWP